MYVILFITFLNYHDCSLLEENLCICTQSLSCVWFFVTPRTVARQAPLSMGFSRQEYWSGLPFPPLEDLPNLGIKPASPVSPALRWIPYHWANGGSPKIVLKNNKWLSSQITSDQSKRSWLKPLLSFENFYSKERKIIIKKKKKQKRIDRWVEGMGPKLALYLNEAFW